MEFHRQNNAQRSFLSDDAWSGNKLGRAGREGTSIVTVVRAEKVFPSESDTHAELISVNIKTPFLAFDDLDSRFWITCSYKPSGISSNFRHSPIRRRTERPTPDEAGPVRGWDNDSFPKPAQLSLAISQSHLC